MGILFTWIWFGEHSYKTRWGKEPIRSVVVTPTPPSMASVLLSYPRADLRGLASVRVEVPDVRMDRVGWTKTIFRALCKAPNVDVIPIFPVAGEPVSVLVDSRENLYLDFPSSAVLSGQAGVEWETLALKALLQSIASTMPMVQAVKILVDGEDRETLWGHVDVRHPFPIRPLSDK